MSRDQLFSVKRTSWLLKYYMTLEQFQSRFLVANRRDIPTLFVLRVYPDFQ